MATYAYYPRVLDELAGHGLVPRPDTPPAQLRDALRELYKYELKVLRDRRLAGRIQRRDYAAHVVQLRARYPLLSVPIALWTSATDPSGG